MEKKVFLAVFFSDDFDITQRQEKKFAQW